MERRLPCAGSSRRALEALACGRTFFGSRNSRAAIPTQALLAGSHLGSIAHTLLKLKACRSLTGFDAIRTLQPCTVKGFRCFPVSFFVPSRTDKEAHLRLTAQSHLRLTAQSHYCLIRLLFLSFCVLFLAFLRNNTFSVSHSLPLGDLLVSLHLWNVLLSQQGSLAMRAGSFLDW